MTNTLHIATYNIHKGFSFFNQRIVLHEMRDKLRTLGTDIIFLQEVVGAHRKHAIRFSNWPSSPQYEFLADSMWQDFAYGKNAIYDEGHHGNAILSRFPITHWENIDISAHRFERRGLLHCEIDIPGWQGPLHCICVHLGLFKRGQTMQLRAIEKRLTEIIPPTAPLVVAGDFNDWHGSAKRILTESMKLTEVFEQTHGKTARSFPSLFPLLRLDRIYVRGFQVKNAVVHQSPAWARISDHAALTANIVRR